MTKQLLQLQGRSITLEMSKKKKSCIKVDEFVIVLDLFDPEWSNTHN